MRKKGTWTLFKQEEMIMDIFIATLRKAQNSNLEVLKKKEQNGTLFQTVLWQAISLIRFENRINGEGQKGTLFQIDIPRTWSI